MSGLVPGIFLIIGLFFIPESPIWLAKVGLDKEFEVALRRLRGKDANVSAEAAEIKAYIESLKDKSDAKLLDLFDSKYIRSVTIAVGLMIFQQIGGINGVGFYASQTFVAAGMSSGNIGTIAYKNGVYIIEPGSERGCFRWLNLGPHSYTNQVTEVELETEKAYKQIDKLKRKHERDISAWKQLIAEKEAIEPVYDDCYTTKYDGVELETTAGQHWRDKFKPFYLSEDESTRLTEPSVLDNLMFKVYVIVG
ncbi:hypothetical protein POM88_001733 [Heracleum sosnowskyi]|uniref:Sugar transporter n=1 Tax=Heracleum sosnowskyi TaxID=360622 RepID=A0AAD8JE42_9APIA|nr:hypothetical protein POM88_001733 [Heracleum sosnowskyi]